jgi:hypothetical protein
MISESLLKPETFFLIFSIGLSLLGTKIAILDENQKYSKKNFLDFAFKLNQDRTQN